MAFTIEQIDAKITKAKDALQYWLQLRALVSDPRFEALENENEADSSPRIRPTPRVASITATASTSTHRAPYGLLKRLVAEHLPPRPYGGITSQQLADKIAATGFKFITKTPAISVNDNLKLMSAANPPTAEIIGKVGLSNLWSRIGD